MVRQIFDALRVFELDAGFARPALAELPAQTTQQSRQSERERACESRSPHVGRGFAMHGCLILVHREPYDDRQGNP